MEYKEYYSLVCDWLRDLGVDSDVIRTSAVVDEYINDAFISYDDPEETAHDIVKALKQVTHD